MKTSKATAEFAHGLDRLGQRFGFGLLDLVQIKEQVRGKHAKRIERQSCRMSLYEVTIKGVTLWAAYDCKRKEVVTVLFPDGRKKLAHLPPNKDAIYRLSISSMFYTREEIERLHAVLVHHTLMKALKEAIDKESPTVRELQVQTQKAWAQISDPSLAFMARTDKFIGRHGLEFLLLQTTEICGES